MSPCLRIRRLNCYFASPLKDKHVQTYGTCPIRIRQGDIDVLICYITVADEGHGFWCRRGGRIGMVGIRRMCGMGRVVGSGKWEVGR